MVLGLLALARPHRADINLVNQVKFEHDRVARAIFKTILYSLGVVDWGAEQKSRVPKTAQHSSWLVVKQNKNECFIIFGSCIILGLFMVCY